MLSWLRGLVGGGQGGGSQNQGYNMSSPMNLGSNIWDGTVFGGPFESKDWFTEPVNIKPSGLGGQQQQGGGFLSSIGGPQGAMLGLGVAGGVFDAFNARKGLKQQKQQFNFMKDLATKNYENQRTSYNTNLEDRIRSRAVVEGRDDTYVQDYLSKHKL